MTELREGAYRFSSRARGQSELIIEELIDPEGETVESLAEVEGDAGRARARAVARADHVRHVAVRPDRRQGRARPQGRGALGGLVHVRRVDRRDDAPPPRRPLAADGRRSAHVAASGSRRSSSRSRRSCSPSSCCAWARARRARWSPRSSASAAPRRAEASATTGKSLDRFLAQHYIRLHTVPLGQWMSMDFANLAKLWNEAPVEKLIAELKEKGPRLGPQNAQIVEQVVAALSRAKQDRADREADERPRPVRGDRADRRAAPRDRAGRDRHPRARRDAGAARRHAREVPAARRGRPREPAQAASSCSRSSSRSCRTSSRPTTRASSARSRTSS